jgi:hypothetical protein
MEEGHWYEQRREEVLTVAALRVAPVSVTSLRVPLQGKPVPSPAADQVANSSDIEDDIPF